MPRFDPKIMDAQCLKAVQEQGWAATYVLRNVMDWPGKPLHRKGLKTSHVLTTCKRLERQGKIKGAPSDYAFGLAWQITDKQ